MKKKSKKRAAKKAPKKVENPTREIIYNPYGFGRDPETGREFWPDT